MLNEKINPKPALGGGKIETGETDMVTLATGEKKTAVINFKNSFTSIPHVFLSLNNIGYRNIVISANNVTTTRANIAMLNLEKNTESFTVNYLVVGI